ncbi:MAG: helix-turn-helix transcriptional regulator [Clostridia bacterium]|nr:helix-turn-helix transcriptional regulator [Clostridia bacterium]
MALTFGEKLRYLREEKELNQTELGNKLGMTQRKLSYIECGKCEPNIDDLRAICMFFEISADYLLDIPDNFKYPKK